MSRFDVVLVRFNPTVGAEIQKTRPALVVSDDATNAFLRTLIVVPMTTKGRPGPTRIECTFGGKTGRVVLDQIRCIDRDRVLSTLGTLDRPTARRVLETLQEMFSD